MSEEQPTGGEPTPPVEPPEETSAEQQEMSRTPAAESTEAPETAPTDTDTNGGSAPGAEQTLGTAASDPQPAEEQTQQSPATEEPAGGAAEATTTEGPPPELWPEYARK